MAATSTVPATADQVNAVANQPSGFQPRAELKCWEKPFNWTINHLRAFNAQSDASCIRKVFDFAMGAIAAIALTVLTCGLALIPLVREYIIQKQEEAFKSSEAQIPATIAQVEKQANDFFVPRLQQAKAERDARPTQGQMETAVRRAQNNAPHGYVTKAEFDAAIHTAHVGWVKKEELERAVRDATTAAHIGYVKQDEHESEIRRVRQEVEARISHNFRNHVAPQDVEERIRLAVAKYETWISPEHHQGAVDDAKAAVREEVEAGVADRIRLAVERAEQAVEARIRGLFAGHVDANTLAQHVRQAQDAIRAQFAGHVDADTLAERVRNAEQAVETRIRGLFEHHVDANTLATRVDEARDAVRAEFHGWVNAETLAERVHNAEQDVEARIRGLFAGHVDADTLAARVGEARDAVRAEFNGWVNAETLAQRVRNAEQAVEARIRGLFADHVDADTLAARVGEARDAVRAEFHGWVNAETLAQRVHNAEQAVEARIRGLFAGHVDPAAIEERINHAKAEGREEVEAGVADRIRRAVEAAEHGVADRIQQAEEAARRGVHDLLHHTHKSNDAHETAVREAVEQATIRARVGWVVQADVDQLVEATRGEYENYISPEDHQREVGAARDAAREGYILNADHEAAVANARRGYVSEEDRDAAVDTAVRRAVENHVPADDHAHAVSRHTHVEITGQLEATKGLLERKLAAAKAFFVEAGGDEAAFNAYVKKVR